MASHWMRRSLVAAACASAALLAACGSSTVESAVSPNRIIAFGDAVTDVGQNGAAYTVNDGTILNWSNQFASHYGKTVTSVSQGGLSYATGNARINITPDAAGNASTLTVTQQIDKFLSGNTFANDDFVLVNGGMSDLIAGFMAVQAGTMTQDEYVANARQWGTDLATQVRRIVNAGGTHVVLASVYDLDKTPWGISTGQQTLLYNAAQAFITGLKVNIDDLGKNVQYMDLEYYVNLYVNTGGSYGFSNSTTAVCTSVDPGNGIGTGAGQINSNLCTASTLVSGADQTQYAFADNVYLTPAAHRQFGDYVYNRVRLQW
ncbi:MAG: SGNH/GDSL hydrolase family protein [Acidovorax sp.]